MTEVARPLSQKFYRAGLVVAFAAIALTVGCGKKPVVSSAPPSTAPPPSRPTVTLTADPTSISKGDTVTLNWTSTNATQLTISPEVGAVAPEGSTKVTPVRLRHLFHHRQRSRRLGRLQHSGHRRCARRSCSAFEQRIPRPDVSEGNAGRLL